MSDSSPASPLDPPLDPLGPATQAAVEIPVLADWLGIQTHTGRDALDCHLHQWTSDPIRLKDKSQKIRNMKDMFQKDASLYPELRSHFTAFATMEKEMTTLWNSTTELEKESYGELMFFRPLLQPLNGIPWVLTLWSFLRIYFLPGMSLLLPLLTLFAPYFILKYALCLPITFSNYIGILHSMLSGQLTDSESFMCSSATATATATATMVTKAGPSILKQLAIIFMTLVQGIIQPYWTYKHLHSIGDAMSRHGHLLLDFKTRYHILENRLKEYGFSVHRCPLPTLLSPPHAVSEAILHPMYFRLALKYVGTLEVYVQLAHQEDIHPVQWLHQEKPQFSIKDSYDIHVPVEKRIPLSVSLGSQQRHALLTGPNKGGKSTVLRALSLSAWLAHTYGCAIGHLTATPFQALCVCLKPDDLPGTKSRFEREIEFTAQTLRYSGPILIFLDELYHSTNPPDAKSSCIHYTTQLWNKSQTVSVISTHLFDWVESADPTIQRICCPAYYDKDGLQFTYQLQPGVCQVSSVELLLQQNGLIPVTASSRRRCRCYEPCQCALL